MTPFSPTLGEIRPMYCFCHIWHAINACGVAISHLRRNMSAIALNQRYIIGVYYVQEGGVCPGPDYTPMDSPPYSGLLHQVNDANVVCYTVDLPCRDKPCKNGGTCVSDADLTSYKCKCVLPFHGKNCEQSKCTVSSTH